MSAPIMRLFLIVSILVSIQPPAIPAQATSTDTTYRIFLPVLGGRFEAEDVNFALDRTLDGFFVLGVQAWGDYDGDGDLDLAIPSPDGRAIQLYRSTNGTLEQNGIAIISNSESGLAVTFTLAWGDYDHDGDLDLAAGRGVNTGTYVIVYRNDNGSFKAVLEVPTDFSNSDLAWADYDGDGYLDLTVASSLDPTRIYRFDGEAFSLVWSAPAANGTEDVDWGDYDGDGDLDLAEGNRQVIGGPDAPRSRSIIYRNQNGTLSPVWTGPEQAEPSSANVITWADYDGDGDLDLASNDEGYVILYRNDRGIFRPAASIPVQYSRSLSWADYDADGDLDLALTALSDTTFEPFVAIYRNTGGVLTPAWDMKLSSAALAAALAWVDYDANGTLDLSVTYDQGTLHIYRNAMLNSTLTAAISTPYDTSPNNLAWADYDGDGDLDAVAKGRIYRNDNGIFTPATRIDPQLGERAPAGIWGDYDADGDLDVAVGAATTAARIYRNDGGTFSTFWADPGTPPNPDDVSITDIAWSDYDRDGDLDLTIADSYQGVRIFRNDGSTMTLFKTVPDTTDVRDLAWGDYDGDGDPDLVVGASSSRLYQNTGADFSLVWQDPIEEGGNSVAWGDYDGDGDPDLALSNVWSQRIWRNNAGTFVPAWSRANGPLGKIDWIDYDGDGDLDLIGSTYNDSWFLYWNNGGTITTSGVAISVPYDGSSLDGVWGDYDRDGRLDLLQFGAGKVAIYRQNQVPGAGAGWPSVSIQGPGTLNSSPDTPAAIFSGPTLAIPYTLTAADSAPVPQIRAWYSLNGGGNWQAATPAPGTPTTDLAASPGGTQHTFRWDVDAAGIAGLADHVLFRIVAIPERTPINGAFQWAAVAANSQPFRLRTKQVRVLREDGSPVAGASVYRLPAGQEISAEPTPPLRPGQPQLRTNPLGYLLGRGPLRADDGIFAMAVISATDTYTLYHTSAPPTEDGLDFTRIQASAVQTLTVSTQHPLVVFNLDISLEWDARNDEPFLLQLERDLNRAADLLYDWSDGQATLGDLRIYQDKQHWNDAHIRIYATNRLRPNAAKGGIVSVERLDPNPNALEKDYLPGQIRIGSVWNRYGEATTNLGDDWARTLAHELGHFALFLDDNYLGLDDAGLLIAVEGCRGAMTDPYRDDYGEFHPPGNEWDTNCANTLSQRLTGRSDWETIKAFYDAPELDFRLHAPETFGELAGPRNLPLRLTRVQRIALPGRSTTLDAPIYLLSASDGTPLDPALGTGARGFLFQQRPALEGGDRLIDLGRPAGDQILAHGARPGDRVCVYELDAARLGCREVTTNYQPLFVNTPPNWQPQLRLTPINSTTLELSVQDVPAGLTLRARLYPSAAPAGEIVTLVADPSIAGYSANLLSNPENPALEGLLHLWVEEQAPRRETVVDFTVGGSPGRVRNRTVPRGYPGRVRNRTAPVISSDGQAILFAPDNQNAEGDFYMLQSNGSPPPPPDYAVPVGRAYRLALGLQTVLSNASLNIGYLGDDVMRGQESGITLYRYDEATARWEALPTVLNTARNEASAAIDGAGLYQLMTSLEISLPAAGWNPIFFYPGATQPIEAALSGIAGHYTTVYGYDTSDSIDPWKVYDIDLPAWVNELTTLRYSNAYWIRVLAALTLPIRGPQSGAASTADTTSILSLPPATYYAAFSTDENGPAPGTVVTATIDGTVCGRGVVRTIPGGTGFSVDVEVIGGGELTGCGRPGVMVQITAGTSMFNTLWDNTRPQDLRAP